jgi:hypothetical protein
VPGQTSISIWGTMPCSRSGDFRRWLGTQYEQVGDACLGDRLDPTGDLRREFVRRMRKQLVPVADDEILPRTDHPQDHSQWLPS